jgi:hypothetical protein
VAGGELRTVKRIVGQSGVIVDASMTREWSQSAAAPAIRLITKRRHPEKQMAAAEESAAIDKKTGYRWAARSECPGLACLSHRAIRLIEVGPRLSSG